MHPVICYYCKQKFDRDKIPAVKVTERRYAHESCHLETQQNQEEKLKEIKELENYLNKIFDRDFVSTKIQKQIIKFHDEQNFSYSGILKTLIYWIEVKGNKILKDKDTIGIVPYIYEEAKAYYQGISAIQEKNKNVINYSTKVKEVEIPIPKARSPRKKLFKIGEDEL